MELSLPVRGHFTVRTFEADGTLADEREADNILCVNGLTVLAAALTYAGIVDVAASLGITTPTLLTPVYGAVGSGTTTPTQNDVNLTTELAREPVSATASVPASTTNGSQSVLLFFFGTSASSWSINEAGVFLNASSTAGTGTMLDHATISPTVTKLSSQTATLQISFTIGT